MKNIYKIIAPLCMAVLLFASCLSDSATATSPECAIISFKVGDIKSSVSYRRSDGVDTVITKTISGSEIYFNIDQKKGLIYTVDSLPNWTNLTKVVASFTAFGQVYAKVDSVYYYLTSGKDSIDFTKPVELACASTDGTSVKHYTVEIRKSLYSTDTLAWTKTETNKSFDQNDVNTNPKVINNTVYMFYNNGSEGSSLATTTDGKVWENKGAIPVDYKSVITYKDEFYGLDADSYICSSKDGVEWEQICDKKVTNLLGSDIYYLYAFDGNEIIGTTDFETWIPSGNEKMDKLPTAGINTFSKTSKTNPDIQTVSMVGSTEDGAPQAWYKISSLDEQANQTWGYIETDKRNIYPLPDVKNFSVTQYNSYLYAIGRNANNDYEYLYFSKDNGISWQPLKDNYALPEDINIVSYQSRVASIITVNDELWIVKGPYIWRGKIR